MPNVPAYGDQRVEAQPAPNVRLSANEGIDAFGSGTSLENRRIRQAGTALVDEGQRISDESLRQANQVQVLDAGRRLSALETSIQYDPQTGAMNKKGRDVLGLPDQVKDSWTKGVGDIAKDMQNPEQRDAFSRMEKDHWDSLNQNIQHHVGEQLHAYDDEVTNSYIQNEKNAAVMNYGDPQRVQLSLDRQKAAIIDAGNRQGMPADWIKEKTDKAVSDTHSDVISKMLANNKDQMAQAYHDAHKDEIIDPKGELDKSLQEGTLRGESQRRVDAIMQSNPSRVDALAQVEKIDDPKLRDAVETRLTKTFTQQKEAQKGDQEDLYMKSANLLDSAPPGSAARDVIPPTTWTKMTPEQQNALEKRSENPPNNDKAWLKFLDLTPQERGSLTQANFETSYWSNFDADHRERAEKMWEDSKGGDKEKGPQLAATIDFGKRVDNTLRATGLIPADKAKSKLDPDHAALYTQFETEAAHEVEQFELNTLGGKRKATGDEMQKIVDGIAMNRVFISKPWYRGSDTEKPAALVTNDEKGNAYVPIKSIPPQALLALKTEAQNLRVNPSNEAFERAYGAIMTGERNDDKVRDILRRRD